MLKWMTFSVSFLFSTLVLANNSEVKLAHFAQQYFDLWVATQAPNASRKDIENYLALLTQDVGHQHLPYDSDDTRKPDGETSMREGMLHYLGGHTEYSASLTSITTGYNVVIIKYDTVSKGIHPQTKEQVSFAFETTEVLEIEDGQVTVIRKYSE